MTEWIERARVWFAEAIGERSNTAFYFGIGTIVFLFSLIATFPYTDVVSSLLAPMGMRLTSDAQHLRLPLGATLDNVRLSSIEPGSPLMLESPSVSLSPALFAMLIGRPGVNVSAKIFAGSLSITLYKTRHGTGLHFTARDLALDQIRTTLRLEPALNGFLSGRGRLDPLGPGALTTAGKFDLDTRGLTVQIAPGFLALRLGVVSGEFNLADGTLHVVSLNGDGPDGTIGASGEVRLADIPSLCSLNLRVTIAPTPQARERLRFMLGFLPHPPDSRPYLVRGPLITPSVN